MNVNDLNNPTIHPEIGPINPVGRVDSGAVVTGTIIFNPSNQRPLLLGDPKAIIDNAIAGGDTTARRVQQFQEAMSPQKK